MYFVQVIKYHSSLTQWIWFAICLIDGYDVRTPVPFYSAVHIQFSYIHIYFWWMKKKKQTGKWNGKKENFAHMWFKFIRIHWWKAHIHVTVKSNRFTKFRSDINSSSKLQSQSIFLSNFCCFSFSLSYQLLEFNIIWNEIPLHYEIYLKKKKVNEWH